MGGAQNLTYTKTVTLNDCKTGVYGYDTLKRPFRFRHAKPKKISRGWDRAVVYHDGDSYYQALEVAIRAARRSINLESYIFAADRLGDRVLSALAEAVQRGVSVRLIVDGIGSYSWLSTIRQRAALAGIQLAVFHELPWQRWWGGNDRAEAQQPLARLFQRLNNRNHRKVCIIDDRQAFVGSMNVIEYHLASYVGEIAWRDTGVYVEGRDVAVLLNSFNELWHNERRGFRLRRRKRSAHSGDLILLNVRRSQRTENYLDLLVRMLSARQRIWIENAYFVPDASLIRVLGVAAESGVDVKVLVPAFSDVVFIPWVASAFHLGLLRAGVRVFEYTKCVLHAKTMLIDEWGLVGSSNLNHRSLLHDLEADAVLVDGESCRALLQQFELDCAHSREITLENWKRRPILERLLGRLLLAVRRVL